MSVSHTTQALYEWQLRNFTRKRLKKDETALYCCYKVGTAAHRRSLKHVGCLWLLHPQQTAAMSKILNTQKAGWSVTELLEFDKMAVKVQEVLPDHSVMVWQWVATMVGLNMPRETIERAFSVYIMVRRSGVPTNPLRIAQDIIAKENAERYETSHI